ncbi:MAG: TetR/AcrR family transcriptional regulator [Bacteroidales bacterium]|nr:TetR/AcrR family transcriptional regulator [Bacteroidales bacterium]
MVNSRQGTEEKILEAAKKVFHRKGFEGARMQEIADEAGINKALLHYYFRSKERLFESVFRDAFSQLMGRAKEIFFSEKPLKEKIQTFLTHYLEVITENAYIPWFILNGMYERPGQLKAIFEQAEINPPQLMEQLRSQVRKEYHSEINPFHIWLNVLSLCIFPVVAKPLIREIFQLPEEAYQQILEQRKTEVPRFVMQALKAYENDENK